MFTRISLLVTATQFSMIVAMAFNQIQDCPNWVAVTSNEFFVTEPFIDP
jgi:hypothetical protein